MEIGTFKTGTEIPGKRKKRLPVGGLGGPGKGKNDGGDDHENEVLSETDKPSLNLYRILTAFLLLVVLMTFGGLIGAYLVISTNGVIEWRPFNLPIQIWVSTVLILTSSWTYYIAQTALHRNDPQKAKKWFLITTIFGATFISSQILVWFELVNRGVYMQSNPYAGFFYIMTALHAVHVLGGIVALGSVVLRNWNPTNSALEGKKRKEISVAVGWYWHFMGALWVILFLLLGFWK